MADSHESNEDHLWEIERIALAYEVALKQAGCKDSIESLLVSNLHLPRAALLKALVETELDVLGVVEGSLARYEHRFPQDGPLLRSIFDAPLDDVRPPLKEGEMVGSFCIGPLLGKGAVGYVYRALDSHKDLPVAIKILRPDRLTARGGRYGELFRNEAKFGGVLDHPRIVKLLGSGEHAGLPYLVFEFVDGVTLRDYRRTRPLPPLVSARIIAQVADAIHYSHQRGIVHRDLKPSNIIVDQSGAPYITDFGIALGDSQQGSGARIAGTPQYMSPEQLQGDADLVDGRSDIYSLGVILYETLSGIHPTLGHASSDRDLEEALIIKPATPLRQRIKVSPQLELICMKALEKVPSKRFSSAADMAQALQRFVLISRAKQALPLACLCTILLACIGIVLQSIGVGPSSRPATSASKSASSSSDLILSANEVADTRSNNGPQHPQPKSLELLLDQGVANLSVSDARQTAKLIVAGLRANPNPSNQYWRYFESSYDNTLQTALIHSCAVGGLDSNILIERIAREPNVSIRCAMLLALGEYSLDQLPQREREQLLPELLNSYCWEPRASVHACIEWLLRRWRFDGELQAANRQLFRPQAGAGFEWFTTLPDVTMVVCDMASAGLPTNGLKFAISTHEISTEQWDWNHANLHHLTKEALASLPRNFESWHTCAAFCNKLSERAGLPASQYCYEQISGNHYRPYIDAIHRRGFRMPTVAEWTCAARAQTTTRRYWGRQDELLPQYANCRPHSLLKRINSGTLKPNGFGLFDVLGNVSEWMHDAPQSSDAASVAAERSIRGGSAWSTLEKVQVDGEYSMAATELGERMGLRLAQSLLPPPPNNDAFELKLQTEKHFELRGEARSIANSNHVSHPTIFAQPLSTAHTTFVGKVSRGETIEHRLLIENRSQQQLNIQQLALTGCVQAIDAVERDIRLPPSGHVSVPVRVKQTNVGSQHGQITMYWSEADNQPQKSEFDLAAFVSGPAVATIGDPLDSAGSMTIDFGTVVAGTKLQQEIALVNMGDQLLSLSDAKATGAVHVLDPPRPREIIGNQFAYCEFQMDTTRNGDHLGSIEIATGDPLAPAIKVNTKVSVKDLARIPVLGLFRDGTWLLDTNHDGHPDESIEFGNPADQPLAGDFDGDGIAELAVVRRNPDGKFDLHIRFLSDAGEQFRVRELEVSTGQIVVGDYDGDERCDVAWVSHPSGAALLNWQIDINGDAQWDEDVSYGFPTDIPVMGDWNGDGRADIGTLRRSPGINAWLLNGIGLHGSYREIRYGLPHDLPIVADWNGDNRTDIGVYRSTQGIGTFLLDLDFDPASERFVHFGLPNDKPIAFMSGLRLPIKEPVSSK